ncbi:MAG: DUF4412 domain-containing protein [Candidatus Binatia bacterium]
MINGGVWHTEVSMRRIALSLTVLFVVCAPAWAGAKDLMVRQRSIDSTNTTQEVTQYWTDNKMVTEAPSYRTITDFGAKTLTTIDTSKKTYLTVTFDDMRQRAAALQKRLQDLPAQARGEVGDVMFDESPVQLKPTGKSEKIAGYEAKQYTIDGKQISGAVWITDAFDVSAQMQARQKAVAAKTPMDRVAAAIAAIKGMPMRQELSIVKGPITLTSTMEVLEVSEKAPPADVLKVPDGFTKTELAPVGK